VFEGEAGLQVEPGLVTLSSNAITVLDVRTAEIQRGPLTAPFGSPGASRRMTAGTGS